MNYYGNSIYFLSPDYTRELDAWLLPTEHRSGAPYRYDIENGAVTRLCDTLMDDLRVDENGIFCTITDEKGTSYVCRVDPQGGECERLHKGFGIQHIGGYELTVEDSGENDGLDILLVNGEEKVRLMTFAVPFYDCIHKGIYYYRDNNSGLSFHSLSLVNGEARELEKCTDYTVFNDKLFIIKGDKLHLFTENEAEQVSVEPHAVGDLKYEYNIHYLYTDNDKLYAVVSYRAGEYWFAQLNISSDARSASVMLIE